MSEYVFFNEPGFEVEAGTEEGNAKNEAYCNVVRYGNIMYAMIENIKNPPKGFEEIIKRHFYLKQKEILREVNKWVKYAKEKKAKYLVNLVKDHNSELCTEFGKTKTRYLEKLLEAKEKLIKAFKSIEKPKAKIKL